MIIIRKLYLTQANPNNLIQLRCHYHHIQLNYTGCVNDFNNSILLASLFPAAIHNLAIFVVLISSSTLSIQILSLQPSFFSKLCGSLKIYGSFNVKIVRIMIRIINPKTNKSIRSEPILMGFVLIILGPSRYCNLRRMKQEEISSLIKCFV